MVQGNGGRRRVLALAWLALSSGCGSEGSPGDAASGGRGGAPDGTGGSTDAGPDAASVRWEQQPQNVLRGWLVIAAGDPVSVVAELTDDATEVLVVRASTSSREHRIPVVGLRANRRYAVQVTLEDSRGGETTEATEFVTESLPADAPVIGVVGAASGLTLFPVNLPLAGGPQQSLLVMSDAQGDIVWYHRGVQITDAYQLSNGHLMLVPGREAAVEIDLMGDEIQRWDADELGIDSIHHEMYPIDEDTFVTLGTELRTIAGYDAGSTTHQVVGDVIAEVTRAGELARRWDLLDLIDPLRTRAGFETTFWDPLYPSAGGTRDWSHGNGVIHDPSDDSFIVSLRHQDWIVKIDRTTGAVLWRFGEDGDFTLIGPGEFPYHSHSPGLTPSGNLMVYDNGNERTSLAGAQPYTRAVEFELDTSVPGAFTARQVWEFRNDPRYFAPIFGDADPLPNDHVLITDGSGPMGPRVVEVSRDGTIVHQLDVALAPTDGGAARATVYRAERIADIAERR